MSEVKSFKVCPPGSIGPSTLDVVKLSDHVEALDARRLRADTAEAELQALRDKLELSERDRMAAERRYEEMAAARDCIATNYNQLSYGASICKEKLAAAEHRIAAMAELLKYVRTKPGFFSGEFVLKIDSALNPNPEAESHE